MKLSDYVAEFLYRQSIRDVFVVSGGASLHLIHAVADHPHLQHICTHHEQSAAMAADAYSRATGNLGAAMATSGPGATNLITGICSSYYDSVPTLYITGQVSTFRNKGKTGVRQIGFQETEIVDMVKSVTNYAVLVEDANRIRYELEKAVHMARNGRPGPVLIDIPDNVQRMDVNPDELQGFTPDNEISTPSYGDKIDQALTLIENAERPVLVLGWGVRLAKAESKILELATKLNFPVILTWAVADLVPADHSCYFGTFGTHGTRYANFALQNADLVLSIGSRLDTKATGSPPSTFARGAKKIMIDIDPTEIKKFATLDVAIDIGIAADAKEVITFLLSNLPENFSGPENWVKQVRAWERKYPLADQIIPSQETVNPYQFVEELSEILPGKAQIYLDTGCALAWFMQGYKPKSGQRVYHAFNNTPMGYALPALLGGHFATPACPIYAICGDGSFMMNIQELTTILHYNIPAKIFLINNDGYAMIRQTQDQWLDNKYVASSPEGGVGMPNFVDVARGFGFQNVFSVTKASDLEKTLKQVISVPGPVFCEIVINAAERVKPQVKFGRPLEDAEPLLSRDEFLANMLIEPLLISSQ